MTKQIFKKGGAVAILIPIFMGLISFASNAWSELVEKVQNHENEIQLNRQKLDDHSEMLKEIRSDVKVILLRGSK